MPAEHQTRISLFDKDPVVKKSILALALMTLSGCSQLPDSLQTSTETPVTDLTLVIEDPQGVQGKEVRLGGVIASVTNEASRTRLEIASLPIDQSGKPERNASPQGRFIAYIDGFADPIEYAQGKLVTVAGQLRGSEAGKIGDFDYTYPVVFAKGQQIWQIKEQIRVDDVSAYYRCLGIRCQYIHYGLRPDNLDVHYRVTP
ncbi:Slp family lipoprotein [Photobacterium halotolerans]|uniref:Slp family lipoprotein n=1 Tax=Photobacterium halotolerans TaxID=265726 RepID=A0A7X5ATU5_9GAMM|nr:Slp family lipoprotein [Photobacterium halotolerans]NAW66828.1 Slp family lipoprotein [Photobacterium halotolerans]NAW87386.1 Slp family lipoprotein [Photobacterium halotolerans]NAX46567.1 Slp family lipoprotein [Photobacterium halotolerans]